MYNNTSNPCAALYHGYNCTGPSLPPTNLCAVVVLLSSFIAATVLGNLLIICSIAFFKQLQTFPTTLALSLALSDFLVGLVIMPFAVMKTAYRCWFCASAFCNAHHFLDYMFTNSSIFHITWKTMAAMLLLCWLGSALFSSPSLVSLMSKSASGGLIQRVRCPNDCVFSVYIGIQAVIGISPYFISLVVIVLVYGRIYSIARRQAQKINSEGSRRRGQDAAAASAACTDALHKWNNVTVIVFEFVAYASDVYQVTLWIGYISSAFNPILYACFNRPFRTAFHRILRLKVFTLADRDFAFSTA
uniref:G-protein coupled receptors family 1 profile domain-containing protein n=1 Tax=Petromyzon marinus TaxID=7757 RepID=S4RK05_PETMA